MLITYQTGKETDYIVSVMLSSTTINTTNYITNSKVSFDAGVHKKTVMYF